MKTTSALPLLVTFLFGFFLVCEITAQEAGNPTDDGMIDVDPGMEDDDAMIDSTFTIVEDDDGVEIPSMMEGFFFNNNMTNMTNMTNITIPIVINMTDSPTLAPSEAPSVPIQVIDLNDPSLFEETPECQALLDYTYQIVYDGDTKVQTLGFFIDGKACDCVVANDDSYRVNCFFGYCEACNEDASICSSRVDRYSYGTTPNFTNPEIVFSMQAMDFDPYLERETDDGSEGNWTGVAIEILQEGEITNCVVKLSDDTFEFDESPTCTCEYVDCGSSGGTQLAFDCGDGKRWGYCNAANNTFDPTNDMEPNDPVMLLNTDVFTWSSCFDDPQPIIDDVVEQLPPPILLEELMNFTTTTTNFTTNATNVTNATTMAPTLDFDDMMEAPEVVDGEEVDVVQQDDSEAELAEVVNRKGAGVEIMEKEKQVTADFDEPLPEFFPSASGHTVKASGLYAMMILSTIVVHL